MAGQKVQLPVVEAQSSLRTDGQRNYVHPADVKGRFVRARYAVFASLIAIWALLPWVQVGGHPAVYLDVDERHFYLFGGTFNAQDFWLVFFLLTGIAITLILVTTLLGRVWCGWACPQTVFMEGVFRRIERFVEGPRNVRMRRNAAPMSFDKLWRKTLKHVALHRRRARVSRTSSSASSSRCPRCSRWCSARRPITPPRSSGWRR